MEWLNLAPVRSLPIVLHDAALSRAVRRDVGEVRRREWGAVEVEW